MTQKRKAQMTQTDDEPYDEDGSDFFENDSDN